MARLKESVLGTSDPDGEKEKLWKRELRYWDLFFRGDRRCLDMVADAFLGWPHNADSPVPKSGLEKTLAGNRENSLTPVLEPLGICLERNVAVIHLTRKLSRESSGMTEHSAKIRVLHTWLKQDREWLLLGGMGYPERE